MSNYKQVWRPGAGKLSRAAPSPDHANHPPHHVHMLSGVTSEGMAGCISRAA